MFPYVRLSLLNESNGTWTAFERLLLTALERWLRIPKACCNTQR